ncbi:MAG: Tad domain-containing protein [Gemmataceae bacterium]
MRHSPRSASRQRRGKILTLLALMLPVLLAFGALTTDLGMMTVARTQLMTVADSGALAGAKELATNNRLKANYVPTTEMAAARAKAQAIGQANRVLTGAAVIDQNADVTIGERDWNSNTNTWTIPGSPQSSKYNSVTLTARRRADRGGLVPAYFSRLWGSTGFEAAFSSTATVQNYSIKGFQSSTANALLLPIALQLSNYTAMLAGQTSDQYTYNSNGTVGSGADGIYESLIFPVSTGNAGNWGTVNIGVSNNSTSTLGDQIRNGLTPAQLANVPGGLKLNQALSPPQITFSGNPGISSGLKDDLTSIIGKPVTVPLYDQTSGSGNNTQFRVIGFGAVRIVSVNFQGNPKYVIVQPALITDPTAIPGPPQGSWTSGGLIQLHLSE